jgi:hypothetical protein
MTVWPALQGLTLPEGEPGLELLVVAAAGTTLIAGTAALADRFVRSAIWQRTVWQVATLGVLSLMLVELTGTGPALVRLWQRPAPAATRPRTAFPQIGQGPSSAAVPLPGEYGGFFKSGEYGPTAGTFAGPDGTAAMTALPVFSADAPRGPSMPGRCCLPSGGGAPR